MIIAKRNYALIFNPSNSHRQEIFDIYYLPTQLGQWASVSFVRIVKPWWVYHNWRASDEMCMYNCIQHDYRQVSNIRRSLVSN